MCEEIAEHVAVLIDPILEMASFKDDAVIVDATLGQGGHAKLLAGRLSAKGRLIGIDVDSDALRIAKNKLQNLDCAVDLVNGNFGDLDQILKDLNINKVDWILADLGWNADQFSRVERGFSFQVDGPLDMRLDMSLAETAADVVNGYSEKDLADIIFQYGEERRSRRIAKTIVERRRQRKIETTFELVQIIRDALNMKGHGNFGRINPATLTFQALRIVVNDELGQLERLLTIAPDLLNLGGQIGIISFHSLEDRIVKGRFRDGKQNRCYAIETKKPIIATRDEQKQNTRSRSAKLRIAKRTNENAPKKLGKYDRENSD